MKTWWKTIFSAFCLLFSVDLFAFEIQLVNRNQYSQPSLSLIDRLIEEVQAALPKKMPLRNKDFVLRVSFENLGGSIDSILKPRSDQGGTLVGYVKHAYLNPHPDLIVMNSLLIEILQDPRLTAGPASRHKTGGQFVLASLLHEVAHILDYNAPLAPDILRDIENCKSDFDSVPIRFRSCKELRGIKGSYSDDPAFAQYTRWKKISKSVSGHPRSANDYQFENLQEYFAIQMEYFLTDSEYPCRMPSMFLYFKNIFGEPKYKDPQKCIGSNRVVSDEGSEIFDLEPSKVLSVSYLHAGPGSEVIGRWGHSMLLIDYCDDSGSIESMMALQNEKKSSLNCSDAKRKSVVLSFRAKVEDTFISEWKGIVGDYPARLVFQNLNGVIGDYTISEQRDLFVYPMELSTQERILFVKKAIELYWTYSGQYLFFGNNCADEALAFLQSILPSQHPLAQVSVSTPEGLRQSLIQYGVILSRPDRIYPSFSRTLINALQILIPHDQELITIDDYLKLPVEIRESRFLLATRNDPRKRGAILLLERYALSLKMQELYKEAFNLAIEESSNSPRVKGKLPQNLRRTYGIPLTNETEVWNEMAQAQVDRKRQSDELLRLYQNRFPELNRQIGLIRQMIQRAQKNLY